MSSCDGHRVLYLSDKNSTAGKYEHLHKHVQDLSKLSEKKEMESENCETNLKSHNHCHPKDRVKTKTESG